MHGHVISMAHAHMQKVPHLVEGGISMGASLRVCVGVRMRVRAQGVGGRPCLGKDPLGKDRGAQIPLLRAA